MVLRQTLQVSLVLLRWAAITVVTLAGLACGADHIVAVDAGAGSHRVSARVGDRVEIRLWGGALGTYASPPIVSTSSVEFIDVSIDTGPGGVIGPGGPTQRYRFRAASQGSAVVTFSPMQRAPSVIDTIVVE
jgi:hypothetical protein